MDILYTIAGIILFSSFTYLGNKKDFRRNPKAYIQMIMAVVAVIMGFKFFGPFGFIVLFLILFLLIASRKK